MPMFADSFEAPPGPLRPHTDDMSTIDQRESSEWSGLLESARAGDDDALGEICRRLYGYLMLVAERGIGADLRTKVGASDIVQQSMLEAHQDFQKFDGGSEAEFRRWVSRLLRRNLIDSARQYRNAACRAVGRETELDSKIGIPAQTDNASQIARKREADLELSKAIEGLPPRQRLVVELKHRDDAPYPAIASRMEISEEAARQLYSRALNSLRQRLGRTDDS